MIIQKKIYLPFLICLVIFSACKKEDVTPPTMSIVAPVEGNMFLSGNDLFFKADMADDQELFQYTVIIESNEAHNKMHPIAPFTYTNTVGIGNKSQTINYKIEVPEAVATGNYILTANVLDYSGNSSAEQKVNFHIQNSADTIKPEFNLQVLPNPVTAGNKFKLQGTLTDNKELGALFISIFDIQGNEISKEDLHATGTETIIDLEITAPAVAGIYVINLLLTDKVNNHFSDYIKIVAQ